MSQVPYIVFEEVEESRLTWTYAEIQNFIFHWNEGFSLQYIGDLLNRQWWEGALLVMSIGEERSRAILSRPKGMKVQPPLQLPSRYSSDLTEFYNEVKENGGIYTVFEYHRIKPKIELLWKSRDVKIVRDLWGTDVPLVDISKKVKRKPLETALLVIDLVSRNHLETRENGLEGNEHATERSSGKTNELQSCGTKRRSA
ncbi:hypothetical protein FHE72_23675 (plasmid) [Rossellomorea vietnamensis]|uniref:Uncharacterized protein n=1 Tax=Rossellomorea vietnamensis TaxID=218284 RepID=A0A6I6ULM5_9BACI|nr:hypothetical protein [Rossellomorea vietnamensis]QHE63994.1 hypothetical protein FHE72_23675 [Rossellomorea vietnamensis]